MKARSTSITTDTPDISEKSSRFVRANVRFLLLKIVKAGGKAKLNLGSTQKVNSRSLLSRLLPNDSSFPERRFWGV